MAVNVLGKFLAHTDNNMRYVALNTLAKIAVTELRALQQHRTTVVECLRDTDIRCVAVVGVSVGLSGVSETKEGERERRGFGSVP
jgi:hypothetical protein